MAVALKDVFIGGGIGYTQHIEVDGTFVEMINEQDDLGNNMAIWGQTMDSSGNRYTVLAPISSTGIGIPHDVVWIPNNSGLYLVKVLSSGQLRLWKYDLDGNVLAGPWTLAVDSGYTSAPIKIDITCDSSTLFYTDQGRTIFKWDLVNHIQLTNFDQLPVGSPYIAGGVKVTRSGDVIVARTLTGTGPRRAIALGLDTNNEVVVWTDEVNPVSTYHVYKRTTVDGASLLSVLTNLSAAAPPSGTNGPTFSLATWYKRCHVVRPWGTVIG